ncbi:serine/threonine-protein phosphatase 6 regulatory ankyrin repeat subunit B-like [Physella acuta]|uniref:serine/threonine-protein phosphatase 6 regulatory ankyrin repeat subunit B-like n=1 Tax=Physella acuta TaxID=109671 RepID=UPI0027DBB094|nr:serine/threonine-protein phosphatase 6 regulatory ankyrin repeat subunit B-like [Physella acuta]
MSNGTTDIFTAAKLGNIEGLDPASINCKNSKGMTALMLAAEANNLEAITLLLKAGADPNVQTSMPCTCRGQHRRIVTALTLAMYKYSLGCVIALVKAGCFFNCDRGLDALKELKYGYLNTVAEGEKVMKKYLKDDSNQSGTAFYVAFINRCFDLLADLINAGVSFNLKSLTREKLSEKVALINKLHFSQLWIRRGVVRNLESLLTQAVQLQDISIIRILIEKYSNFNIENFSKNKALQVACSGDRVELINVLLVGAKMQEFSCSYIEIVKLLVSSGADVNLVDEDGSSLLIKAVQSKQMEIVKFLLEKSVNIDQADDSQSTALHYACRSNSLEIVKLLVNAGAKIEVFNNESYTPFSEACKTSNREMMELLIKASSDINCVDTYQRTPLINSIMESKFALTQFLLEHGADISNVDIDGMTALMWAAKTNNEKVFDRLLNLKPEVNFFDRNQTTALAYAVMRLNVQMVAKLIQAGADVNIASNCQGELYAIGKNKFLSKIQSVVEKCSRSKNSPLHLAGTSRDGSNEIVNLLLKAGANTQAVDEHGRTPLHIAATACNLKILQSLCQFGANINAVDNYGNSPLFIALLFEKKDASKYLLECGADVNLICDSLCSPLFVAVLNNDTELVNLLIQYGANLDMGEYSEILVALENRSVEMTIALLEHGANANMRDTKKEPALTIAIKLALYFDDYIFATPVGAEIDFNIKKIWIDNLKLVAESFLNNGANISAMDDEGNTCLHAAAELGDVNVLELFVAHKADVNVQNVKGETPLMMACCRVNVKAVRYLLSVEADVTLVDVNKDTALHHTTLKAKEMSRYQNVILEMLPCTITHLIENNANINARNGQGNTALHLTFDDRTDLKIQNNLGETALHHAFNDDVARALLEMGADMEACSQNGRTALICATVAGEFRLAEFLLARGANVNAQDNNGKNALMLAIENYAVKRMRFRKYNTDFLNILLEHGAVVNASDATGQTACMIAVNKHAADNFLEVLPKLVAYGADLNKVDNKNRSVLVHILLNFDTNKWNCILEILKLGADLVVDNEYGYLVKKISKKIEKHKEYGRTTSEVSRRLFQFCLVNGCILLKAFNLWGIDKALQLPHFMSFNSLVFVKYLFATGMIFKSDFQMLRKFKENDSVNSTTLNIPPELQLAIQQPWPLVKLAFIEVSTLLGTGPMREEKLKQTKLPPRLQRTLMFQEPISRLPVEDWSKIPLCFDPVQYETLPCPRPLLYYWPVGHKLVN